MNRLPGALARLPLPIIGSPLFIISHPQLVIAQCIAGVVGSMPALNARPASQLDEWLAEITETLAAHDRAHPERPAAPFAINQIVHKSNDRLEHDMAVCVKYKVPIYISSLGAREDINAAAHSHGGVVLHDVINNKHARKAIEKGADGLIAVAATGLGEQVRVSLARIDAWIEALGADPSTAPLEGARATNDDDRASTARLRAAIAKTGLPVPALDHDLDRDAAIAAVLVAAGARSIGAIASLLVAARLPVAIAEALRVEPGAFRGYPMDLPRFVYESPR